MKRCLNVIGIVLLLLLYHFASCNSKTQVPEPEVAEHSRSVEGPSHELSAIDSMMWKQPDSALSMLQEFVVSPEAEALDTFDGHYCQVLISELLYKNDYEQTNREDLLQAVAYFDSIMQVPEPVEGPSFERNAFLTARAHYINGVGYYENDSAVEACKEYIKALEVMEDCFEEKEVTGKKAKFMAYICNRLGEMFEKQYMMEPAINCYKRSFDYSLVSPISSYSVSNALYRIGKQFNMKGEKDSANYYYSQALVNMPDSTNLYYRDVVSNQAILSYQLTHHAEASLKRLNQMVVLAEDDDEKLTRYLAIGSIFFEEGHYDSACLYLEPVLLNEENKLLQNKVANYLRIIYDSLGCREKLDECMQFLALHNETGAENSALVSQLSDLFKIYMSLKQEKESEAKREHLIKTTMGIVIPISAVLAIAIIVLAKQRSKKMLKDKEKHHQQEIEAREIRYTETIEAERQEHHMKQAAISGRLRRRNEEVRELKGQIRQQTKLDAKPKQAELFKDEPICRIILARVNEGQFLSQMDCTIYKDYALSKEQVIALRDAVDSHFGQFTVRLAQDYPNLTKTDLDYCCFYLLGLTDADIAALMQRAYNTVNERNNKLRRIFGSEKAILNTLQVIANNYVLD